MAADLVAAEEEKVAGHFADDGRRQATEQARQAVAAHDVARHLPRPDAHLSIANAESCVDEPTRSALL